MIKSKLFGIAMFLLFAAGAASAIAGVNVTGSHNTRWSGASAASLSTQGGNITEANISSNILTSRWASFWGNVAGNIVLGNGNANVYTWSWAPSNGGDVCLSTGSNFDFSSIQAGSASEIDSAWSFGAVPDNATNTFTTTLCDLTFAQGTVANATNTSLKGSSTFNVCAIRETAGSAKNNHAFCTVISTTGKNYANQNANYEIMVPTGASETYYFYAELA